MNCPKCGKPMVENKGCPGIWMCEDYRKPQNDRPPFRYACTGLHITDAGYAAIEEALAQEAQKEHQRAIKLN